MNNFIESAQNPKIKSAAKLKKSEARKESGQTLVEGEREIMLAKKSKAIIDTLFFCEEYGVEKNNFANSFPAEILFRVSRKAFDKISFRENPDGLIAVAAIPESSLADIIPQKNSLVLIAELVEKPGNLGALLRTSDAAGLDCVIVADPKTDIYHPNVIRASQGTIFTNQIACASSKDALAWLRSNNFQIVATSPSAEKLYSEADYSKNTAIIVGAEDKGLSSFWMDAADQLVKIPMLGEIDSLNVSVSAAIIIYEALRQRRSKK